MNQRTIADLQNEVLEIQDEEEETARLLQDLAADREILEQAITVVRRRSTGEYPKSRSIRNDHTNGERKNQAAEVSEVSVPAEDEDLNSGMNLRLRDIDFSSDKNMEQRVIRIAQATTDGIVISTHVRDILHEAGESKSSRTNLRNTVQKLMSEHEDFQRIGRGRYSYVPMAGANHESMGDAPP